MNLPLLFSVAALLACVAALQWVVLRSVHDKRLAAQHRKHQKQQAAALEKNERARQQIAQLQRELAMVRAALKQRSGKDAVAKAGAVVDSAPRDVAPQRPALPVDGFAETLPSSQFLHGELLVR